MPLQNRVDPFGNLIRTFARGTPMGNRGGVFHNAYGEIVRAYAGTRWITCLLQFRGRHREVMYPNRYTKLFFLDEAVALAAGGRPCAECRRGISPREKRAHLITDRRPPARTAMRQARGLPPATRGP